MEITKREVLASISIVAILLLTGFLISGKISQYEMDKNEMYNKAIQINTQEMFEYGMRTDVGNAFIYGELKAVDPVSYPDVSGRYMYLKKVKEKYTKHRRTYKDSDGKKHTKIYWTWDYAGEESQKCTELTFLNNTFSVSKIVIPDSSYIDTVKESRRIRYVYYGTKESYQGTLFTCLSNKTISDNSPFYKDQTIEETMDYLESGVGLIIFWICWIVFIGVCVYGFYYLDNRWLE